LNKEFSAGKNQLNVGIANLANGVYFLKLSASGITKKFVVNK